MSLQESMTTLVLLTGMAAGAGAQQAAPPPEAKPTAEIKVVTTEPVHALVLPMKGSYLQHQAAFERLSAYLAGRGVAPAGAFFGRYFDDPSQGEANLTWEIGVAVPVSLTAEAPFEIKDLPAMRAAVRVYRGPMEELVAAWPGLIQWVIANGYQPVGPAIQVFKGLPASVEVEMRMPVTK